MRHDIVKLSTAGSVRASISLGDGDASVAADNQVVRGKWLSEDVSRTFLVQAWTCTILEACLADGFKSAECRILFDLASLEMQMSGCHLTRNQRVNLFPHTSSLILLQDHAFR